MHAVGDRLTNAVPGRLSIVVVEGMMDAAVEPEDHRLEGVGCVRLLGRQQAVVDVGRVRERLVPEHVGEDMRRRT